MEDYIMSGTAQVRDEIVDFLRRELIGPDPGFPALQLNGEEILRPRDPPRLRYSAGVLFPCRAEVASLEGSGQEEAEGVESGPAEGGESDDDLQATGEGRDLDSQTDQEVNRANEYLPSVMGISALVFLPEKFRFRVSAGRYEKQELEGAGRTGKDGKYIPCMAWWRVPVNCEQIVETTSFFANKPVTIEIPLPTGSEDSSLALHIFSRPYAYAKDLNRERIITFTLINRNVAVLQRARDEDCFFQCGFSVEAEDGRPCFLDYPERISVLGDEEEASLRLLYRHRRTYAVGHGCAADWIEDNGVGLKIHTESMPTFEIRPILPREIGGLELSMLVLSKTDGNKPTRLCRMLAEQYEKWIAAQELQIDRGDIPTDHQVTASNHLMKCRECLARIKKGIELLESDNNIRLAFALMNRAMLMQQVHYELASNSKKKREWKMIDGILRLERDYEAPDYTHPPDGKGFWRPFQLAFILMNLSSISRRESEERKLVDLIWFPTGGGKTEAYLGLTAFTIFWRRLKDPDNAGTTVLMRYTLRLLTTQQYQRAASLICACEKIRREHAYKVGELPISIGLWVGGDVSPIRNADAVKALQNLMRGDLENPFVVLNCPWCGAQMGAVKHGDACYAKGYHQRQNPTRVEFCCDDPNCIFGKPEGLPLHVVDEAIYNHHPTLVIGTVDKFALLPWRPEARSLFGLHSTGAILPPDLIIQDELHLISGALGSMVGHYEGVLEALCTDTRHGKGILPKIIASTATICHAPEQVKALYGREVLLFPPQGLKTGDSFFAEERRGVTGRLYVGVFGSALSSHITGQIRVVSTLLQSVKCLPATDPKLVDPYMTLMAYFNSLRELGHAATLIRADIREYMNAMWDRLSIRKPEQGSTEPDRRRFINRDRELTSRIASSRVSEALEELFAIYTGDEDARFIDICLATNMIQVGLDVPRLGLMTVVGQPKTTSEYIQATSRVGRQHPGLVVTIYNPARPRDRSHFEHFRSYHESIYRWVEPTSVTPFAAPVRERALHAQIITLARYWGSQTVRERPQPPPSDELFGEIRDVLIDRVKVVDPGELASTERNIRDVISDWKRIQPPRYGGFGYPRPEIPLMHPSGSQVLVEWQNQSLPTPTSMRNVDEECNAEPVTNFILEA
jgi:hypothetical protein